MEYEILYPNDNGTVKVRMTINDHILEQDFPIDNLENNVLIGMAIFNAEINANQPPAIDESLIGTVVQVDTLPEV